ncbi:carboxylate-amine ligase [Streptomyces hoynatensis]|uniref:Putative glutamate--cysteine ligase 2 n=1 Tax=Streptomyces hoynatensis TaxID=1141874 RepID=A0A3A9Z9F1_9ACTN|nr:glutamate--cysteine ligase [Streptomyces hoynatensis]RKN44878.1 YbdK family carboxylate-amine ligase [Streptomyces hoynatensis]
MTATTVGVEEEYLLLDPEDGRPLPLSRDVLAAAGRLATVGSREVEHELLQAQVEVGTPVCRSLGEVDRHLRRLRAAVRAAAAGGGARLAASGTAPAGGRAPVTDRRRYLAMLRDAPRLVDEQLICGMHVHVGVEDREAGVAVLDRIGPWLPVLVALGANSPYWEGADTGFASWRTVVFGRWPVSGPPPAFADAAEYGRRTRALLETGVIRDLGQVYWQARLSERYPTVEVRAPDVQLEVADAVALAGVARGLVRTALREEAEGLPRPLAPPELLAAANWRACRHGLTGSLVHPGTARCRPAAEVVEALLGHLTPALREAGDLSLVSRGLARLLSRGTGADRQRRTLREADAGAYFRLIEG